MSAQYNSKDVCKCGELTLPLRRLYKAMQSVCSILAPSPIQAKNQSPKCHSSPKEILINITNGSHLCDTEQRERVLQSKNRIKNHHRP